MSLSISTSIFHLILQYLDGLIYSTNFFLWMAMDGKATSMVLFGALFSPVVFLLLLAPLTLPYLQLFGITSTSM